jgi:hypothetical protein
MMKRSTLDPNPEQKLGNRRPLACGRLPLSLPDPGATKAGLLELRSMHYWQRQGILQESM